MVGRCDVEDEDEDAEADLVEDLVSEDVWVSGLVEEVRSRGNGEAGDGVPVRDRDLSRSFSRFVRSICSNCTRKSLAQTSS